MTTVPMRSSYQSCVISEESYCTPWDLKIQTEKLKLLNEQHQISLSNKNNQLISVPFNHSNINKPLHRTYSVRKSSTKKSFIHRKLSPPALPPFPPGGLIPSCQCSANNKLDRSDIDTSRSVLFASTDTQSIPFETTSFHFKHLNSNNSLPKIQTAYEQPWDTSQTSLINNLHRRSLQKIPTISPCRHSDETTTIPIDRYFWYHYTMSRRQAENILESRPSGSFLVRQSESGNQNDYSLSIKTITGCMHMRICYSDGFYILGECSRPFRSVSSMIKYFSQTSVPIRGATHIKLGTPVLRWEILSSSLSNKELL